MSDTPVIYECPACGTTGDLNSLHHEEVGEALICRECNGDGELCLQTELQEHNEMVQKQIDSKPDFSKALDGDIF